MILSELEAPIVLAPMAGGPSTPQLTAAVADAGGFGVLASGYLTAEAAQQQIAETRSLTQRRVGVNVFVPPAGPTESVVYEEYLGRLAGWAEARGAALGVPRYDDDDFDAKVEMLIREAVAVVSFTFGAPPVGTVERLRSVRSEVWITVTSPEEADRAVAAGADALIVQGAEAGGHRGSFADEKGLAAYSLLSLLQLIASEHSLPLVAAGAITTGAAVASVLTAGAAAAQLGTAFLLSPEAGTSLAHREALRTQRPTGLTRAFTGRLARGIRNEFMAEHDAAAPIAYPEIHHATAPLRKAARERHDESMINLWAGETHALAREAPAGEIVRWLTDEARAACTAVSQRLGAAVR